MHVVLRRRANRHRTEPAVLRRKVPVMCEDDLVHTKHSKQDRINAKHVED